MEQTVLARIEGGLGRITLNRPEALNALTLEMIRQVDASLTAWEGDAAVMTVLIEGAGDRGLCAGGDIVMIYEASTSSDLVPALTFFEEEYRLIARLQRYGKPIVAFMDGLVIGGGVGISAHTRHRIVTGTTALSMPETAIGFIPDVGGTFLLSRAPGELGTHLALTGCRIGAADAILLGLADLHVERGRLQDLATALRTCETLAVADTLRSFASQPDGGVLSASRDWIDSSYVSNEVEAILDALSHRNEEGAAHAAKQIRRGSPTSSKVALRALREARTLTDLEACLAMELRIAKACLVGHDMREGIRAAIIDKDRDPRWWPSTLEDVTTEMVDHHLAGRWLDGTLPWMSQ